GAVLSNAVIMVGTNNSSATLGSRFNSLIVSNGGYAALNGLSIGSLRANSVGKSFNSNNFVYVSNTTVAAGTRVSSGFISVGSSGGTGNTGILDNVMWTGNGGTIDIGSGRTADIFHN